MKRKQLILAASLACVMVAAPVSATPNFAATVSGSLTADGSPDSATADFTFNDTFTSLSMTLTNTDATVKYIASVFDGIAFSLRGVASNALTLSSLSNPDGTVNCTKSGCSFQPSPVSLATSGWTYDPANDLLAAGNGSFKPYGIVNGNVIVNDGIPNGQHNPYLVGPVTFVFSVANPDHAPLALTSADLYFGSQPAIQTGTITSSIPEPAGITTSIPEPGSYALMLAGLAVFGLYARRGEKRLRFDGKTVGRDSSRHRA